MANSGDTARLLAFQAELRRLRERVEPLEGLHDQVSALVETIESLADDRKQSKPPPAWWPTMVEGEHAERWPQFLAWLRDVLAPRYPADARKLTKCWADHPTAVDALTACWLTWQAAYLNRAADVRDAAAWQTQFRPQLIELAGNELSTCRSAKTCQATTALPPGLLKSFAG